MDDLHIREAEITDRLSLALLCNQLGYQTEAEDILTRLDQINMLNHQIVLVAVIEAQVVG